MFIRLEALYISKIALFQNFLSFNKLNMEVIDYNTIALWELRRLSRIRAMRLVKKQPDQQQNIEQKQQPILTDLSRNKTFKISALSCSDDKITKSVEGSDEEIRNFKYSSQVVSIKTTGNGSEDNFESKSDLYKTKSDGSINAA